MERKTSTNGASIRASLDHPIVDGDGHLVESLPVVREMIREMSGSAVADRFFGSSPTYISRNAPLLPTSDVPPPRRSIPPWWALPTGSRDRATSFLPHLLYERLDDLGIDFAVLFPSLGLTVIGSADDELRVAACRALNRYAAELLDGLGDRLAAVATIPCHTPEEALAELDHAVVELGFKSVMLNSYVRRLPGDGAEGEWFDLLALDSCYDYDPVWARCVELGVAVTVHTPTMGLPLRASPTRYMANHIGNFAASADAFAKALVFGGVMDRFPTLSVAFLECGVSWGVQLLADLIGRWEKRGGSNILNLDPSRADFATWDALVAQHGGSTFADPTVRRATFGQSDNPPAELDDFRDSGIDRVADIVDLFDRFYFGCEADDPTVHWAFADKVNPEGAQLRAMLGSDVGHWDVTDMDGVLHEAWELVEHGLLDAEQFRRFGCDNAIQLHGSMNPTFFDGTRVEQYARQLLATGDDPAATG